jgi:hypothetical protein
MMESGGALGAGFGSLAPTVLGDLTSDVHAHVSGPSDAFFLAQLAVGLPCLFIDADDSAGGPLRGHDDRVADQSIGAHPLTCLWPSNACLVTGHLDRLILRSKHEEHPPQGPGSVRPLHRRPDLSNMSGDDLNNTGYYCSFRDLTWCDSTTFGSGVARAIIWRIATGDGSMTVALNYEALAAEHEFTARQVRAAVARLIARGFARVERDFEGITGDVLVILTPGRLAADEEARASAHAKAVRHAAKLALRGGQVTRAKIPDVVKAQVYARDNFTCQKCGATENLTLDHIHPWSIGGPDTVDNLRVLCRPCNSRKGDRT